MTPHHARLVQQSFANITNHPQTIGIRLCAKLFELAPGMRARFPGDLTQHIDKMMELISMTVCAADQLESVAPVLRSVGRVHGDVESHHFMVFEKVLVWTLAAELGDRFDENVREAWLLLYSKIVQQMMADNDSYAVAC